MNDKKSLLEKYSIPIEHLDFEYIRVCQNVREVEQMLEILHSGQEGYYPDLTKFTENKLRELHPDNRMLRKEVNCQRTNIKDRVEINTFVESIKEREIKMRNDLTEDNFEDLPPVRTLKQPDKDTPRKSNVKRITATEYSQWDKYDADTECLKIDLSEERMREKTMIEQKHAKLIEILPDKTMNDVEKHVIADKHRIKGNEYFKCSDNQQAIAEYTTSLTYESTAAAHNNRALVYLKEKNYIECIRDCDECLRLDPVNVKAMLRKCEALLATDNKNNAYKLYSHVLEIDPENAIANKALANISIRLEIEDINANESAIKLPTLKNTNDEDDDDIFKKLIIPKKIVPSKLAQAMKNMKHLSNQQICNTTNF